METQENMFMREVQEVYKELEEAKETINKMQETSKYQQELNGALRKELDAVYDCLNGMNKVYNQFINETY